MKKVLPQFLLFISLLSLVSCTITKRKYTGGFYVSWNKKVPDAIRPHPCLPTGRLSSSYEERGKSRPQRTCEVAPVRTIHPGGLRRQEKSKFSLPANKISTTYETIYPRTATSRVQSDYSPSPMHVESVKARNRDNGLTGFEIGLLNIIDTALLIFFGHIGYLVFIIGFFLIFLFLFISGIIYSFMGLNRNDKHRGLGLLGVLIEAGVLTALIIVG